MRETLPDSNVSAAQDQTVQPEQGDCEDNPSLGAMHLHLPGHI